MLIATVATSTMSETTFFIVEIALFWKLQIINWF